MILATFTLVHKTLQLHEEIMTRTHTALTIAIFLGLALAHSARADETKFIVEFRGYGGQLIERQGPWDSFEEAQTWAVERQKTRNDNLLYKIVDYAVKPAKEKAVKAEKLEKWDDDLSLQETERLKMVERSKIVKAEYDAKSAEAKAKQREIGELIEQIGRTNGAEQLALLNQLRQLQKSGAIKDAATSEAKRQDYQDEYQSAEEIIAQIEKSMAEKRKKQLELIESLTTPKVVQKVQSQDDQYKGEVNDGNKLVVGKWSWTYIGNREIGGYGYFESLDIRSDGTMYLEWGDTGPIAKPTQRYIGAKGTYKWRIDGLNIVFEQVRMEKGTHTKRFERKLDDFGGKYRR